jgi:hypothetical protein
MKKVIIIYTLLLFSCFANSTVCNSDKECKNIKKVYFQDRDRLLGNDLNNDGIRDDVEIAIQKLYPNSKDNRLVARNTAKIYQKILLAYKTQNFPEDDIEASNYLAKLAWCYNAHTNLNAKKEIAKIKFLTLDNKERVEAFEKFKLSRNGTVQSTLKATYNECRFSEK